MGERLSGRGRRDQTREIKKNNNNNIDFSKQIFLTLNLKLHSDGEDAEEILNLGDRDNNRKTKKKQKREEGEENLDRELFPILFSESPLWVGSHFL